MTPEHATRLAELLSPRVALAVLLVLAGPAHAADPPPVTTSGGVVAADHEAASAAGARVLAAGGNAVDAAVATALALGVVNPTSSGLGGGGFALVYLAREGVVHAVDFREMAPAALTPALFTDPEASRVGGLAVGVPGEPAGLAHLVATWGTRSWRRALGPAIRLARDGFVVSRFLARATGRVVEDLPEQPRFAGVRALIVGAGAGLAEGETITRPALAVTLATLAADGAGAFYRGPLADDLIATVTAGGGVMTAADLAGYAVLEREPLWATWRGYRIAAMPLPSSGGIAVLEALGLLDATGHDLRALGPGSAVELHLIAEVLKHAFADRARVLGDTRDSNAAVPQLLDPARLAALAKTIDLEHTGAHAAYGGGPTGAAVSVDDAGTSHLCVIDRDGNAVSLTTTVNGYFGSRLMTAGGVVLNNQVDDFALKPGQANGFGLVQSDQNLVAGGKRPLSSMSPTLVLDASGKVVACVGGSGGPRIISATLQVLIGSFALGRDAAQAVGASRIHHQWTPDVLQVDDDIAPDVVKALAGRGHTIKPQRGESSIVQLIRVRDDGVKEAASDPRKGGRPVAAP